MLALDALLILLAAVGHLAIWIVVVAKVHATGLPWWTIKVFNKLVVLCCASIPLAAGWYWYEAGFPLLLAGGWRTIPWPLVAYGLGCVSLTLGPLQFWFWERVASTPPAVLQSNDSQSIDLVARLGRQPLGTSWRRWPTLLPFNNLFELEINEKRLALPRLDGALAGLSIAHISDLHFDSTLDKSFFEEIIDLTNQQRPDLIAVTGDIMEHASHLPWVPEILARLTAPHGVFVILGNHDLKLKQQVNQLRQALTDAGLNYLGGRWEEICVGDGRVLLAGNELPWLAPAADVSSYRPPLDGPAPLRVLLSHSPDQFLWARQHDFDLMLAGHNHGGQFRFPLVGPIIAPSHHVARYASGLFYEPPTALHVSRGISANDPLRIGCGPEITRIVLEPAAADLSASPPEAQAALAR